MRHEIQGTFTHPVGIFTFGQCQAYTIKTSQGFYIWIKYFVITSSQALPAPSRPSLQHKTECDWGSFNTIWYLNLIISDPPCPGSLSLPDTVLVLFAETCFYGGGDCGESNTGHRQRGNQPHGTHIPVSSWPASCTHGSVVHTSDIKAKHFQRFLLPTPHQ